MHHREERTEMNENDVTPIDDEAPEEPPGTMARGHYKIKSKLIDDDKNVHLAWEWAIDIKKDWE